MKPLVIYHAHCTDGFGAAFAAWLKLGDNAEYLPMEYGQGVGANLPMFEGREVYILDFSFPKQDMDDIFSEAQRVVWLDHHKTAFETWLDSLTYSVLDPNEVVVGSPPAVGQVKEAYRNTDKMYVRLHADKSGAMLAWEYFHPDTEVPMLIQHIDDRDRWQFKLDGSRELHAAMNSLKPWTFSRWDLLFHVDGIRLEALKDEGSAILRAHSQHVQAALKQARPCSIKVNVQDNHRPDPSEVVVPSVSDGYLRYFDGLSANAPSFLASDLGHELANKSGTFGLVWSMAGDGQIHCSLRSNGDYDVSAIAKVFGGGGHRNAAGFSVEMGTLLEWIK